MSRFHQLSGGNTWSAARTLSASGVSNITGFVIFGIGGRARSAARASAAALAARSSAAPARGVRAVVLRHVVLHGSSASAAGAGARPERRPTAGRASLRRRPRRWRARRALRARSWTSPGSRTRRPARGRRAAATGVLTSGSVASALPASAVAKRTTAAPSIAAPSRPCPSIAATRAAGFASRSPISSTWRNTSSFDGVAGETSIRQAPGTTARRFEGESRSIPSQNVFHIFEQVRVRGQRAALGRVERPVLPRAPGPAALVARRPELEAGPAAHDHLPLAGQQRVDAQPPLPVLERDERGVAVARPAVADARARGARPRPAARSRRGAARPCGTTGPSRARGRGRRAGSARAGARARA